VSSPFLSSARAFAGRLAIALVLVSTLTVAGVSAVNRGINDRLESVHKIDLVLQPAPPEGANYVILGSDTRSVVDQGDGFGDSETTTGQRSDTLMVAHVEPKAQKTFVVSFPRDLVVVIPGFGKRKINEAYNLGGGGAAGAQLVIQTLEANFPGLKLNHFVQVDFRSFREVVDAIGTVNVYFPLNTRDYDTAQFGDTSFEQKAGCAALNGDRALQYVRSRHLQEQDPNTQQWKSIDIIPDIARIGRQQSFIRNLAGTAIDQSLSDPFAALDISDRVQSFLGIDDQFGRDELNQLVKAFRTIDVNDTGALEFATIPWRVNSDPQFGSSLVLDQPAADDMVARLETFGDTPPPRTIVPSQVKVRVIDATGQDLQSLVAESLAQQGFIGAGTGVEKFPLQTTDIRYAPTVPSQVRAAKLLLDYFPDARLVPDPLASDFVILVLGANFAGQITVPATVTTAPASGTDVTITTLPAAPSVAPASTTPAPTTITLALGSPC
jgi:LCP family protein required for cell wall assembly